jgi:hypothetical protein
VVALALQLEHKEQTAQTLFSRALHQQAAAVVAQFQLLSMVHLAVLVVVLTAIQLVQEQQIKDLTADREAALTNLAAAVGQVN